MVRSVTAFAKEKQMATKRMPVIFLAHGAPYFTDDDGEMVGADALFSAAHEVAGPITAEAGSVVQTTPLGLTNLFSELHEWANDLPRPKSVLMLSAHWEARPLTIGATRTVPLIYDFYGFPEPFYQVEYAAPGAPELAQRVKELIGSSQPLAEEQNRGLDHGAYVPMAAMYPEADVPVLQVSLPTMDAPTLFELGRTLASLREEGVLIVGSGFITHNLRAADPRPNAPTPSWASEFDSWSAEVMVSRDADSMVNYRERAPGVQYALPTHEHFVPAVVALGAAIDQPGDTAFPIEGFVMGSLAKRSVQYG
jgi:4,5-DOPA dioxygenase extradiol